MRIIDAHTHVWTPDTAHYPLAAGFDLDAMKPPSFTPEEMFEHTKRAGVERVVLIQMSFYGTDNRYMLDMIRLYPGMFSGVAVVDHRAADLAATMRELHKRGVCGFRVRPVNKPAGDWLGEPGYGRMFETAAELGMAICPLIDPDGLPSLDRRCRQDPRTTVVIDHICRIGVGGTIRDQDVQALCRMARYPQVNVKISAFYALGSGKPPHDDLKDLIHRVFDAFGARRLMWASDNPYAVQSEPYTEGLDLVRNRLPFLTADDKEWLLHRTAERVFFDGK